MATVIPMRPKRTSRGPRPASLVSALEAEPPPPPPWDLSMVRLPRWFMPMLRDLMEVAERTFGPSSGQAKRYWVLDAARDALGSRPNYDADDFSPAEFQRELVSLLIEGIWSLEFRPPPPPPGALTEALAKLKALGGKITRVQEAIDPRT